MYLVRPLFYYLWWLAPQAHTGRASSASCIACRRPDIEDEQIPVVWPCGILRVKGKVCHECKSRFLYELPCSYPGWYSWLLFLFDDLGPFFRLPAALPDPAGSLLWALWRPFVPLSIYYASSHGKVFGGSCFIFQDDAVLCHHFHGFDMNNSYTSQELSSSRIPRLV